MVEFLIEKGAEIKNVFDAENNSLLMMFIQQGNEKAMIILLENGFDDIYWENNNKVVALSLMASRNRLEMMVQFCEYIMTNNHRFGGEAKVCQHIVDTKAASLILGIEKGNTTRQQLVQMAKRHKIGLGGYSHSR